ncbi:MAG: response regulator [Candidatus Symbiothrix sp.]|jgi:signal transduction histidine kinase/ligand-binding sensor domain-containing protein/DNA-binding response OmpR family regulator|nr:response regulator [Candidatus Symbiothrix sp.]
MWKTALIAGFCTFFSLLVHAEKISLWTPNDGLSNSHISQIYQDSQGYIWIATENGLNKFNGYQFTVYFENPDDSASLQGNYIYSLMEDKQGRFWVGSLGGLFLYNRDTDSFHLFPLPDERAGNRGRIKWILEDESGNIWLSRFENGIVRLDAQTLASTFFHRRNSDLKYDDIDCVYEDNFGNLWLGTHKNGVYLFNPVDKSFRHFQHNRKEAGSLNDDRVFAICEDGFGRILIGTFGGGINIYDRPSQTFSAWNIARSETENQIYAMTLDRKGVLWIGTDGGGILRYDLSGNRLPMIDVVAGSGDLTKSKVHYLFEDKQGNIWANIYQQGLLMIPATGSYFENFGFNPFDSKHSIGTKCVISLLEDQDRNLWIGTDGAGLYKVNATTHQIEHFTSAIPGFRGDVITALFEDRDRNIWIGTYINGMFRYNRESGRFDSHYSTTTFNKLSYDHVSSFVQDNNGVLWIGLDGGGLNGLNIATGHIEQFKSDSRSVKNLRLPSNWVYTLYLDKSNMLWLGTYSGVAVFDPHTKTFVDTEKMNQTLDMKLIYAITSDAQGNTWLGGLSGLYCVQIDKQIKRITTINGLPNNMITGIIEDNDHYLWLSTGNGLCRYNPSDQSCMNFYAEDGIQSNEFRRGSYCKGQANRLYFGGINGVTTMLPSHFIPQRELLHLAFSDLLIYNEPVHAGKNSVLQKSLDASETIRLKYNQRSFTFRFAAIEYATPQRVSYYAQMENFDMQWRKATNRSVTYTNLNPGKYVFKVKATIDGEHFLERSVTVIIDPPIWLSIWAKILYVLLFGFLIYLVYQYLHNRMKQNRILMEKEQQKQLSESKLQFFTDISHEIRTPLTLILGPIEKLEETEMNEKTLSVYKIIHQNALRILRLVNQLMDLRAVDKGKLKLKVEPTVVEDFITKIMDSFRDLAGSKRIDFTLVMEDTLPEVCIDRDCIDKVIFNLLSNAFKFTPKDGRITIYLGILRNNLEISVEDTGIGIAKEYQEQIFDRFYQVRDGKVNTKMGTGIGLHLSKMMIELHHGEISVESEAGSGSKFTVQLPLNKDVYKPEEFGMTSGEATATMVQPSFDQEDTSLNISNLESKTTSHPKYAPSVLIVEDDVDISNYISSELSKKYKIYHAVNGKDGLNKTLKYLPDLIVSDIVMPEMDGLTLCKLLKTNDKTCHIPIVLLTAKTNVEQRIEGIEMGADSYIPKPFNMKHLETRIAQLIKLRRKLKTKYADGQKTEEEVVKILSSNEKLIQKFNDKLREQINNPELSVESLSKDLGISRVHLNRRLKQITNESPGNYIRNFRLKQAALLLSTKKISIAEVAYAVGFSSQAYFSNTFKEHFGMPPSEYAETNYVK